MPLRASSSFIPLLPLSAFIRHAVFVTPPLNSLISDAGLFQKKMSYQWTTSARSLPSFLRDKFELATVGRHVAQER